MGLEPMCIPQMANITKFFEYYYDKRTVWRMVEVFSGESDDLNR
jgi:hypothetical protein